MKKLTRLAELDCCRAWSVEGRQEMLFGPPEGEQSTLDFAL